MIRGKFITIEGTDGSGKTTQIKLIEEYLKEKGYNIIVTREPGGTDIGEKIRKVILEPENVKMSQLTEMLLYASSRAQIISELIRPAIDSGKIVICDRFVDSTYAYQGYGRGIDMDLINKINDVAIQGMMPDITFFFDISPDTALKRRLSTSVPDRIEREQIDFHNNVYKGYKAIASLYPKRIKTIDAGKNEQQVFEQVKRWLESILI